MSETTDYPDCGYKVGLLNLPSIDAPEIKNTESISCESFLNEISGVLSLKMQKIKTKIRLYKTCNVLLTLVLLLLQILTAVLSPLLTNPTQCITSMAILGSLSLVITSLTYKLQLPALIQKHEDICTNLAFMLDHVKIRKMLINANAQLANFGEFIKNINQINNLF